MALGIARGYVNLHSIADSTMNPQHSSGPFDLVICDIDGCLAPESATPFDVAALQQVGQYNRLATEQRDRPVVTVCSGRPQPFVEAMCRLIHNRSMPAVAENGTWLYVPGENEYLMDPDITAEHLDIVHEASRFVMDRYGPKGVTLQPGKTASVTLYHRQPEFLQEIMPEVQEELSNRDWPFRVSMTWLYINCDLEFVSKASGVRRLLERTGTDPARVAGIGDTTSDLPVAEAVRYFACPANASEDIRRHAHYVSPHEEAAGVLDILEQLRQA